MVLACAGYGPNHESTLPVRQVPKLRKHPDGSGELAATRGGLKAQHGLMESSLDHGIA